MQEINFLKSLHSSTKRNYLERVNLPDRAECMRIASQYGKDYWDGDRKYGYGGYTYDGRWKPVAEEMTRHYSLNTDDYILDIGCGKGFLLSEFTRMGYCTHGLDISPYAICDAELHVQNEAVNKGTIYEVQPGYEVQSATRLPYADKCSDFVYSINVLHNLNYQDLKKAISCIARVMQDKAWICVESFRSEEEKCNLLNWALTCQSYYSPDDWKNILTDNGYNGDVGFVYFE